MPTETGTGFTEPAGAGYARQDITQASFTTSTGGSAIQLVTPASDVVFGPASGNWGTIRYVGLFDTTGALLAWDQIAADQVVNTGGTVRIAGANLSITLD
ncbi:MAG: hypothetical protein HC927_00180 [Deltaproteobacteria bacterium]|nr:hypothetical protein [Deltaproteobacteria bacterium]